jgi:ribonuclease-3
VQLQQRIGYEFRDSTLLKLALTHRSAAKENNERLEFLGDSLINHVVAERLFLQFPEAREGQLSRLRAKLVRGTYLAEIANQLDLGSDLILGTGERKGGGRHRSSILADTLEALVGAIFLDAGFAEARATIMVWFADSFHGLTLSDERDAKTR